MSTSEQQAARLCVVKWRDITAMAGWEHPDDVNPTTVRTAGWLYSDDLDVLKVGDTLGEDGIPYGVTAIPRGCVVSVSFLDDPE